MSPVRRDIRLLRVAEDDLTDIVLYVASERPDVAMRLTDRFYQKLELLADNPHLGAVPKEESLALLGYRYLVLENYLIFYVVEDEVIYIHRVVHGARDYTQLF